MNNGKRVRMSNKVEAQGKEINNNAMRKLGQGISGAAKNKILGCLLGKKANEAEFVGEEQQRRLEVRGCLLAELPVSATLRRINCILLIRQLADNMFVATAPPRGIKK